MAPWSGRLCARRRGVGLDTLVIPDNGLSGQSYIRNYTAHPRVKTSE